MKMVETPPIIHAISGAIGSSVVNFAFFPLDIVIVRLQVRAPPDNINNQTVESDSIIAELKQIIKREGWPALYQGSVDDWIGTILQTFLYFYAYEYLRGRGLRRASRRLGAQQHSLRVQYELLYGSAAGLFCKLFTTPIKNIVVQKQIDIEDKKSLLDYIKLIYCTKGFTGFWSGYKASLLLSMNPSLSFYFFQRLRIYSRSNSTAAVFLSAAIAKSLATILTYPLIQAKTRMQASRDKTHGLPQLWNSMRKNKFRDLLNGIHAQIIKGFLVQGLTFATKETITKFVLLLYLRTVAQKRLRSARHSGV